MDIHIFKSAPEGTPVSSYIPLNVMSDYSIGESIAKLDDLIERAKGLNMKALALTDRMLAGALEFYQKCIANDIKPIIGQRLFWKSSYVILLCKNLEAYKILCRRSLDIQRHDGLAVELPITKEEAINFVCISPEAQDIFLQKLFGEDFYAELEFCKYMDFEDVCKRKLEKIENIQTVITNPVSFINDGDEKYLCAIRSYKNGDNDLYSGQSYFVTEEEITHFAVEVLHRPDLIENTSKIADKIDFIFPENYFEFSEEKCRRIAVNLPEPDLNGAVSVNDYFVKLVEQKFPERFDNITPEVRERLDFELKEITANDWAKFFIIPYSIIQKCNEKGIMHGPGRGAASGSLVAYILGITDINPLEYGLIFERFCNSERNMNPDFDIDFEYERYDEVIEIVKELYGKDYVSRIFTCGRINERQAFRIAGKALGFPEEEINCLIQTFPIGFRMTIKKIMDNQKIVDEENYKSFGYDYFEDFVKLKSAFEDTAYSELISFTQKLEGIISGIGLHASGYIITKEPCQNYVPLQCNEDGDLYCEYRMDQLEAIGLYKNDFLGLRELSKLKKIKKTAEQSHKIKIDLNSIPLDDEKTLKIFRTGKTDDVFQFEAPTIKRLLRDVLKPDSFNELVILNAMFRPGLMDWIPHVEDGKFNGYETHIFKDLVKAFPDILEETYGVPVYQEQIMLLISRITSLSLGQAELIRRVMGKKRPDEVYEKKLDFIERAMQKGMDKKQAESIFENLTVFAAYAFNKSHAVAYTKMAFWDAYLKVHFPEEYEEYCIEEEKKYESEKNNF